MKILFYDAKKYDIASFEKERSKYENIDIDYESADLTLSTASLADGYDAVCVFVSSDVSKDVVYKLGRLGVKLVLLRCAGFNNVDLDAAKEMNIKVLRVPGYSPEAVAEFAISIAMAVNRRLHKSYIKVRENNFALNGLTGMNFYGKTAGIIGTGKIGAAMCRICKGFGMKVIAYDKYHNPNLDFVEYYPFEEVLKNSDLISLHCPLTSDNYHMINKDTIDLMKDNVILVNTSRGALVDSEALIAGIRRKKFFGVALDVYEEETDNVFEDRAEDILETSIVARLLSFPNVIVTSHQGFLTEEALEEISKTTIKNAVDYENNTISKENECL